MHRISAACLVIIISVQAFYNAGVLAYWCVNHAYIAAVLCENRDKPEMHCNGKCYLHNKLVEQQQLPVDSEQKAISLLKGLELAELPASLPRIIGSATFYASPAICQEPNFYTHLHIQKVFHPPGLNA